MYSSLRTMIEIRWNVFWELNEICRFKRWCMQVVLRFIYTESEWMDWWVRKDVVNRDALMLKVWLKKNVICFYHLKNLCMCTSFQLYEEKILKLQLRKKLHIPFITIPFLITSTDKKYGTLFPLPEPRGHAGVDEHLDLLLLVALLLAPQPKFPLKKMHWNRFLYSIRV